MPEVTGFVLKESGEQFCLPDFVKTGNETVVQHITWTHDGIIAGGKTYKTEDIFCVRTTIQGENNG